MSSNRVQKVSQRLSLTCLPCAKSKVRCSKTVPCQRCINQGRAHLCSRQAVQLNTRRAWIEQDFELKLLQNLRDHVQADSPDALLRHLNDRIAIIGQTSRSGDAAGSPGEGSLIVASTKNDNSDYNNNNVLAFSQQDEQSPGPPDESRQLSSPSDAQMSPGSSVEKTALALTLEYLAWGRNYQQHDQSINKANKSSPLMVEAPPLPDLGVQYSLPPVAVAQSLVKFHLHYLCWHHNSMHSPTFLSQCEAFWDDGSMEDPSWISLYIIVLATAAWCYPKHDLGWTPEELKSSSERWYNAMLLALHQNDYMSNHTIFSIQAIAISTLLAHPLGHSNSHYILLSSAIRIAQCLGLDKLREGPAEANISSVEDWDTQVETQVGRRVWWQLVIQDYFAVPFADTYTINPNHFSTSLPRNCDDHDLKEMSGDQPTISSYCLVLAKMAHLMPQLVDGAHALSNTPEKHYQHVLDMDLKMRSLVSQIPSFLLRQTTEDPNWPAWVGWARKTLTISAADKIIMIHRSFLIQSFQNPMYAYTRTTCLSAAITILREYERIYLSNVSDIWIVPAFTLSAGIIVALDLLYKSDVTNEMERNRELLRKALKGLSQTRQNKMAVRGAHILTALLKEEQERRESGKTLKRGGEPEIDLSRVKRLLEETNEAAVEEESLLRPVQRGLLETGNLATDASGVDAELQLWFNESLSWNMMNDFELDPLKNATFVSNYGQDVFNYDPFTET